MCLTLTELYIRICDFKHIYMVSHTAALPGSDQSEISTQSQHTQQHTLGMILSQTLKPKQTQI